MRKLFGASLFLGLQTHQQRLKSTPPPPREGYRSFPLAKGRSGCSRRPPELGSLLKLAIPPVKEFVMSFSGAGPTTLWERPPSHAVQVSLPERQPGCLKRPPLPSLVDTPVRARASLQLPLRFQQSVCHKPLLLPGVRAPWTHSCFGVPLYVGGRWRPAQSSMGRQLE